MEPRTPHIRIDRSGRWTADGAPVRHARIFQLFHQSLECLPNGSYRLAINGETCPVEVEDLPFAVQCVRWELTENGDEIFHILLNTGEEEILDPGSLREDAEGRLSCNIRESRFEARFTREALGNIEPYLAEADGTVFLITETRKFPIKRP